MTKVKRLLRYDWPLHFILFFTNWLPDNVVFIRLRGILSRPFFLKCGKGLRLGRNLVFYNPSRIIIGEDNYIAFGNWFASGGIIRIGDRNLIGPYSIFAAGNHIFDGITFDNGLSDNLDIIIGNDNWIGSNCKILGGTHIRDRSLIGAGVILTKELEDQVRIISKQEHIIVKNR